MCSRKSPLPVCGECRHQCGDKYANVTMSSCCEPPTPTRALHPKMHEACCDISMRALSNHASVKPKSADASNSKIDLDRWRLLSCQTLSPWPAHPHQPVALTRSDTHGEPGGCQARCQQSRLPSLRYNASRLCSVVHDQRRMLIINSAVILCVWLATQYQHHCMQVLGRCRDG
jgi:hypothetical protein